MNWRWIVVLTGMVLCSTELVAKEVWGGPEGTPLIQLLDVVAVDPQGGRILFEQVTSQRIQERVRNGRVETERVYTAKRVAFVLKHGVVMTGNGREVSDADLWKRVKAGNRIILLSPDAIDGEDRIRATLSLFKDDTLLLNGVLEDLPMKEEAPAKKKPVQKP